MQSKTQELLQDIFDVYAPNNRGVNKAAGRIAKELDGHWQPGTLKEVKGGTSEPGLALVATINRLHNSMVEAGGLPVKHTPPAPKRHRASLETNTADELKLLKQAGLTGLAAGEALLKLARERIR